MSIAILDHGSEVRGTDMSGAGEILRPFPSRWHLSHDLQ